MSRKLRKVPHLTYKFRVAGQDVEVRVPPVEGDVIRMQAHWSAGGPHVLSRDGHVEYVARRDEVLRDVRSKLSLRGRLRYEVIHAFTPTVLQATGSERRRYGETGMH